MQVHPSRAGLIPDARSRAFDHHDEGRSRYSNSRDKSPRPSSPPPTHSSSRVGEEGGRRRGSPVYESYERVGNNERDSEVRRDAYAARRDFRSEDNHNERQGGGGDRERRATPERALGDGGGYGGNDRGGYGERRGYGAPRNGGGDDWFESRRKERDASSITIWPPSPKAPARAESPSGGRKSGSKRHHHNSKHKSSSSKSKKHRHTADDIDSEDESSSGDDDSLSEDDDKRRRSSKKHKSSSEKHRSSRTHATSTRSKHRSSTHRDDREKDGRDTDEESDNRGESRRQRSKSIERRRRSRSISEPAAPKRSLVKHSTAEDDEGNEEVWEEAPAAPFLDDGEEVGPLPISLPGQKAGRNAYGGALLKGEGSAMAAFVQEGARIPRRGEIGMESDQIERFEAVGYVMSGSRHRRMNAVRVRKENQVISAEEKRGILKMQAEEKAKRENQIVASFKELVDQNLGGQR